MKKILILLITLITITGLIAVIDSNSEKNEKQLNWITNLEQAKSEAARFDKKILVNFTGSDWCTWCIRLDKEVFSKEEFIDYANDNLVCVKLDFPRQIEQTEEVKAYNQNLAKKYEVKGFPTILLLDAELKTIAQTGYQSGGPKNYVKHIESLIK